MAAATPTTHEALAKHLYPADALKIAAYKNNTAAAMIKKAYDGYGQDWHMALRIAHTAGRSHTYANAKANKTGSSVVKMQISVAKNYSAYSVDGLLQKQLENDKGALADAFKFELDSAMDAFNRNMGYEIYGSGTGVIGRISSGSTVSSTTITLDNINDIVKFEKNQVLKAATTSAATTLRTGTLTVSSVDRDAGTVTFTVAGTTGIPALAASDYLVPDGDATLGIKGFDAWIPSAAPSGGDSFFGLDRSVDPSRLAGSRVDGSGLSYEEALQKACQVGMRNGAKIDTIFMNDLDFLNTELSIGSRRQYADVKTDVGIGFTGIKLATGYGMVEIFADANCPQSVAYCIEKDMWCLKGPGQFPVIEARDGNRLVREASADAFEGLIVGYYQLQCKMPSGQVRLALPT